MTLLDTIPVYVAPTWTLILFIIGGVLFGFGIIMHESDWAPIPGLIGALIIIACLFLNNINVIKVHDHDEYVVRLDNSYSATEFLKDYEIVKTYEYSDAWRVKKKDGVK